MKILCQADDLYQTVRIVQNSIPSRSTVPILKSVNLVAEDGTLSVAGTDLEVGVRIHSTDVEVEETGTVAIPADRLSSLLSEFDEQQLELSTDGNTLEVRYEGGDFKIVGHDPEDFPEFPSFEDGPEMEIDGDTVKNMVDKTSFAVADEMQMYALTGLYCRWTPDNIEMVGSDGNRLARYQSKNPNDIEEEFVANVPPRVLEILSRMIEDDEPVTFTGDESKVQFRTERGLVYSRQVEGNYPDYQKAIPKNPERKIEINRDELESALKKVSVLTPREMPVVRFLFDENMLKMTTRSQEFGEGNVKIPVDYDGESLEIVFNPNYILDVLSVLDDESIQMELSGPKQGGIVREGNNYLYVMMPLDQEAVEEN